MIMVINIFWMLFVLAVATACLRDALRSRHWLDWVSVVLAWCLVALFTYVLFFGESS